jgi:hypothetical protein
LTGDDGEDEPAPLVATTVTLKGTASGTPVTVQDVAAGDPAAVHINVDPDVGTIVAV